LSNVLTTCDVAVKFWGDLACFTRPEFKVDRVTYPVMTPSAARGVLEAIFWKPEIRWEIREIWVLNPIKEIAIMRNEIENRQGIRSGPIFIEDRRQQRTGLFLKEPKYLVLADIRLKEGVIHTKKKYLEQVTRHLLRGSCHHQPYLGTRECTAFFAPADGNEEPQPLDLEIGNMLFDIAYCCNSRQKDMEFLQHLSGKRKTVSGFARPLFFTARLQQGIMKVPWDKYMELYRWEGVHVKGAC